MREDIFVLMDLDDTILDFHKAEAVAIAKTFKQLGAEASPELISRYSQINQRQWERLELGEIDRHQVLTGRFEILFSELGMSLDGQQAQDLYEELLSIGHWFMPGAEEMLKELYGKYRLFIVSNGTPVVQQGRLKSSGIGRYFEHIFISEEIGATKPEKRFFDICAASIPGFCKERAIIVGDSLTSDIRGGINAGIPTCWYNPRRLPARADIPADFEIHELSELPGLLESLFGENS